MSEEGQHFLNRELGWLKFNHRVLFQAKDHRLPLLERIKFLNIFNTNFDEFFMKRVGGLQRQYFVQVPTSSIDGLNPEDQLRLIRKNVLILNDEMSDLLQRDLLPQLKMHNIHLLHWHSLSENEQRWAHHFFRDKIFPVLTPMAVDLGHPFPLISNLSMSLAVSLQNPGDEDLLFARIKIPDIFPVWLRIPNTPPGEEKFISCSELIQQHLSELFPRMTIKNVMAFRVTRNLDIDAAEDEEGAEDLLELIEEEVRQRRFAEVVRLEYGPDADPWLLQFLTDELELGPEDVYVYPLPLEYKNLNEVSGLNIASLKFKPWNPITLPVLADESVNIFNIIKANDILVHHPYDSFTTSVERFIQTAAQDPQVLAIKMTLYRTSEQSPIVHSLIRAAESGKQVVCIVELKARMDEERNIYWAHAMERAGIHVVYGILGLKTHAKIALVVRHEKDEYRSYVHIGTGNYHPQTAKVYTDMGLLTSRNELTNEVVELFHYLTGRSLKTDYQHLLIAPVNLKQSLLSLIAKEAENAQQGLPSGMIIKVNNLEDRTLIEALYRASQLGVKIQLIVRGFSCLRPQVKDLSENISLISIIGPFLEHSRIYYFRNGQNNEIEGRFFIGSADWMNRNLLGRLEVVCPVEDRLGKEKIWETLQLMLKDQRLAWDMGAEGNYIQRKPQNVEEEIGSQDILGEKARFRSQIFKTTDTGPGAKT
ncbi:MAG: polyphosphate kinase 1 [Bdellovibrionales bacterium]|nr:polyphosphate kinase 1 [Bdellovibrionales bacterium]